MRTDSYVKRSIQISFVVFVLVLSGACQGSEAITEGEAVSLAEAAAIDQGLALDGLMSTTTMVEAEWHVSFSPTDPNQLGGGFLVMVDAGTGALNGIVEYQ